MKMSTGIEWTPINLLTVNLSYLFSKNDSDDASFDFSNHTLASSIAYHC